LGVELELESRRAVAFFAAPILELFRRPRGGKRGAWLIAKSRISSRLRKQLVTKSESEPADERVVGVATMFAGRAMRKALVLASRFR